MEVAQKFLKPNSNQKCTSHVLRGSDRFSASKVLFVNIVLICINYYHTQDHVQFTIHLN